MSRDLYIRFNEAGRVPRAPPNSPTRSTSGPSSPPPKPNQASSTVSDEMKMMAFELHVYLQVYTGLVGFVVFQAVKQVFPDVTWKDYLTVKEQQDGPPRNIYDAEDDVEEELVMDRILGLNETGLTKGLLDLTQRIQSLGLRTDHVLELVTLGNGGTGSDSAWVLKLPGCRVKLQRRPVVRAPIPYYDRPLAPLTEAQLIWMEMTTLEHPFVKEE